MIAPNTRRSSIEWQQYAIEKSVASHFVIVNKRGDNRTRRWAIINLWVIFCSYSDFSHPVLSFFVLVFRVFLIELSSGGHFQESLSTGYALFAVFLKIWTNFGFSKTEQVTAYLRPSLSGCLLGPICLDIFIEGHSVSKQLIRRVFITFTSTLYFVQFYYTNNPLR